MGTLNPYVLSDSMYILFSDDVGCWCELDPSQMAEKANEMTEPPHLRGRLSLSKWAPAHASRWIGHYLLCGSISFRRGAGRRQGKSACPNHKAMERRLRKRNDK